MHSVVIRDGLHLEIELVSIRGLTKSGRENHCCLDAGFTRLCESFGYEFTPQR
jgi:hypothetical protein